MWTLRSHQCNSNSLEIYQIFFDCNKFWSFNQSVVLVFIVKTTSPIVQFLEQKAKCNNNFAADLRFWNTVSRFWLRGCASSMSTAKLKTPCLPFSISESAGNGLNVHNSSFKLSSLICSTNCVTPTFLVSNTLCSLCKFCLCKLKQKSQEIWWQNWHLWSVFGWDKVSFFATCKFRAACGLVGILNCLGQQIVPTKDLFLYWTELFFEVSVSQFLEIIFSFQVRERIFVKNVFEE